MRYSTGRAGGSRHERSHSSNSPTFSREAENAAGSGSESQDDYKDPPPGWDSARPLRGHLLEPLQIPWVASPPGTVPLVDVQTAITGLTSKFFTDAHAADLDARARKHRAEAVEVEEKAPCPSGSRPERLMDVRVAQRDALALAIQNAERAGEGAEDKPSTVRLAYEALRDAARLKAAKKNRERNTASATPHPSGPMGDLRAKARKAEAKVVRARAIAERRRDQWLVRVREAAAVGGWAAAGEPLHCQFSRNRDAKNRHHAEAGDGLDRDAQGSRFGSPDHRAGARLATGRRGRTRRGDDGRVQRGQGVPAPAPARS